MVCISQLTYFLFFNRNCAEVIQEKFCILDSGVCRAHIYYLFANGNFPRVAIEYLVVVRISQ